MRQRLIVVLTVVACSIGPAACGGADDDEPGKAPSAGELDRVAGFDGTTMRLGVLSALTGPLAVIGEALTAGNEVYFAALNAKGGLGGRYRVQLAQEDTQFQSDVTVQKYNRLKGDVVTFAQIFGTAPTLAVLPQLERDKVIAAPASLDAFWVREPNLLPVGGPYQVQAINALDYYVTHGGAGRTVCSMIQDDAYGEAGQQGVEFAAEQLGFELAATQRYKLGDKDVTGQVQRLSRKRCDAVFLGASPSDAGTIWGTAAKLGFAPRWIAQSAAWIDELAASPLKEYLAKTTWVVAEGTEWGDESVPGMKQMLADIEAHKPGQEPDYYFSFGYIQARAVTALLEQAIADGDVSRAGLLAASQRLGTVSFDGLAGAYRYGPAQQRDPSRSSTIFRVVASKPFGLGRLAYQYESDAARKFAFTKADL